MPPDRPALDPLRDRLLDAVLTRAPFDGWSANCLAAAADDLGIEQAVARRCFPRGTVDLLTAFSDRADRAMLATHALGDLAAMKIRARIAALVRARLEHLGRHRDAMRRAVGIAALPSYAPAGVMAAARTVDLIWRAAGDTATDFNFYSKRGLLAGVYGTTLLFWLNDRSPGAEATWRFLDRRIEDVMTIQKLRGRAESGLDKMAPGIGALLRRVAAGR